MIGKQKKVTAIVPMRHDSERVPGKNYRDFSGKPLYHHIVSTLLACKGVDRIVIDTDSPYIIEDATKHLPEVVILERPEHLRAGEIPMNDVLINILENLSDSDFYLQTHSTNPLLKASTIDNAIEFYTSNFPMYDSLFGVTRFQSRLWDQLGRPINHNSAILLRTQDLPPIFNENSCLYMFTKELLQTRYNRIGVRPYLWEISQEEAIDIDEELDFEFAEFVFSKRKNEKR